MYIRLILSVDGYKVLKFLSQSYERQDQYLSYQVDEIVFPLFLGVFPPYPSVSKKPVERHMVTRKAYTFDLKNSSYSSLLIYWNTFF